MFMRHPKTTQEKRITEAHLKDPVCRFIGVKIRRARVGHNLPEAWDDVFKDTLRSWKMYRDTQYKPVSFA